MLYISDQFYMLPTSRHIGRSSGMENYNLPSKVEVIILRLEWNKKSTTERVFNKTKID